MSNDDASTMTPTRWQHALSWLRRRWWVVYLLLLVASLVTQMVTGSVMSPPAWWYDDEFADEPTWVGAKVADIPEFCDDGPLAGRRVKLGYLEWAGEGADMRPPVILLHGSPGQAFDWTRMAPVIAAGGYRVIAADRLGFGRSSPWVRCYSARSNARAILALMDELEVDRAHLVGWSHGGPVILNMADIAPERLASLTMMGATGEQRVEGSGSYVLGHVKYGFGYGVVVIGLEFVPHFGVLDRPMRHAFIRDFWDSDQRPLSEVLRRVTTPTMILQGRHDPLVPERAARVHHEMMPASRLVMLDAGHLFPFYDPSVGAPWVLEHVARHDAPGAPALTDAVILEPERVPALGSVGRFVVDAARWWPWWLTATLIVAAFFAQAEIAAVVCASLVATQDLDFGVAMAGMSLGVAAQGVLRSVRAGARREARRPFRHALSSRFLPERTPLHLSAASVGGLLAGALLWAAWALIVAQIAMMTFGFDLAAGLGLAGLLAGAIASAWIVRQASRLMTWTGRRQLLAMLTRLVRYEFWNPWIFYVPLGAWLCVLSIRYRGVLTFTCVNPGVSGGGGTVGERKSEIMPAFGDDPRVLRCVVVERDTPAARANEVDDIVTQVGFDGYPVIIKPDAAQRGHGVKLVHTRAEAEAYFRIVNRRSVVQPYHPGPYECGVLWIREPDAARGSIFSITNKVFQELVGDGERTIGELVYQDKRLRAQARVFLKRFDGSRVPRKGEVVRLSIAGNHAQGAKFLDGAGLITPGLEAAIDELCLSFRGVDAGELDFGRFDLRYESEEALSRGEFGIVELNGAMSESTNIYDPSWSMTRAYSMLFEQWRRLYELGAWRRSQGRSPMRFGELAKAAWRHYVGRRAPAVSD